MRTVLLLLVVAVWPVAPRAQPTVIPLDRALALARERSSAVLAAAADVDGALASLSQARDARWPSLTASAGAGQRYGLAFDQTTGGLTQATVEALDLGLYAQAVVYDGGARRARVRSAQAAIAAAQAGGDLAREWAALETLDGFLAAAQAEAALTVAQAEVQAQERLMAEVETLVEFGVRPASETAQQRERLAAARGSVLDAEQMRALAEARLVSLLGLDPSPEYAFPIPAEVADDGVWVDARVAQAVGNRAEVRAAQADVQTALAEVAEARAARRPGVAVVGGLGTSFTSAGGGGLPGQLGDNRAGQLGLHVSVPILDRGAGRGAVHQSGARLAARQAAADQAARAVALEVREAALALAATEAQAEIAVVRVEAAQTALVAEQARYQAGETTLQAVAQLRARAVDAATRQAVLDVTARVQRVRLQVLAGG